MIVYASQSHASHLRLGVGAGVGAVAPAMTCEIDGVGAVTVAQTRHVPESRGEYPPFDPRPLACDDARAPHHILYGTHPVLGSTAVSP